MPTYSYLCDACGKSFEKEQRIVEDPIKKCAFCGKDQARRQIVSGNFILKGGGWYSDGYGSSSSKAKAQSDTGAKAEKSESSPKADKADSTTKVESPKADSSSSSSSSSDAAKGGTPKTGTPKAQAAS